jgi:transcriptional regulator with XRE-family HTH domain
MNLSEIGKTIKTLRKEKNLTQDELAKMANISRPTLSKLENGELGKVSIATFVTILRILGYDLEITPFNPFKKN